MNSTTILVIATIMVCAIPWVVAVLLVSRAGSAFCDTSVPAGDTRTAKDTLTLTVLFDNYAHDERLKTGWGFSCLVTGLEKTILFDTGDNGTILLSNMGTLGIEPTDVDIVVLSHEHHDHVGGLEAFLEKNHAVKVFVPASFSEGFKRRVRAEGATVVEVSKPCPICQGAQSSGQLGTGIEEQALCVNTANGLFVITGCAHPGIVEIVRVASTLDKAGVYGAMGGFHMGGFPEGKIAEVIDLLKAMGVSVAGPCHCSGDLTRKMMRQAFNKGYLTIGVGSIVELQAPAHLSGE